MINRDHLQTLADSIAKEKLPDGSWKLDDSNYPEFYNLVKSYVWKSASRSDRYDTEDAYADVMANLFLSLKRHGSRYHNKPFYEMLKIKTNNVLTNRFHKRESYKNHVNYIADSLDDMEFRRTDANFSNKRRKVPYTFPMDMINFQTSVGDFRYNKVRKDVKKERKMTVTDMYKFIDNAEMVDKVNIFYYICGALTGNDSETLKMGMCELFSNLFGMPRLKLKQSNIVSSQEESKDQELSVVKFKIHEDPEASKESQELPKDGFPIGATHVGQEVLTRHKKRIQVLNKTEKSVRIMVIATEKEMEIPSSYIVYPILDADQESSQPKKKKKRIEALRVRLEEKVNEVNKIKDVPIEEETLDADQVNEINKIKEEELDEDYVESVNKIVDIDQKEIQLEPKKARKSNKMKVVTIKQLVVELLKKGEHSKDELAQAIIDKKLSKKSLEQVKNYVSVILSGLRKNKEQIVANKGKYKIA